MRNALRACLCALVLSAYGFGCQAGRTNTPPSERSADDCRDGADNDDDGFVDCNDNDCADFVFCLSPEDAGIDAESARDAAADGTLDLSVPACGPATCAGCCTGAGACVVGSQQSACGTGGALCDSCLAEEMCAEFSCQPLPPSCSVDDTEDDDAERATVGCNGAPIGPTPSPNGFGAPCTRGETPAGTCVGTGLVCMANPLDDGICLRECTPGGTYVSAGGCPSGSRCFALETGGYCYPDCFSGSDCATNVCDGEGSCAPPGPPACSSSTFDHDENPWTPCVEPATSCLPGSALVSVAAGAYCESCPVGTHCAGGTSAAVSCSDGSWDADSNAATACVAHSDCATYERQLAPGTSTRDRTCEACPANWISLVANSTTCDTWSLNGRTLEPTYTIEITGVVAAPFDDQGEAWDWDSLALMAFQANPSEMTQRNVVADSFVDSVAWVTSSAVTTRFDPPEIFGDARLSVHGFPEVVTPLVTRPDLGEAGQFARSWEPRGWKHVPADESLRILVSLYDDDAGTDDALSYVLIGPEDIRALAELGGPAALGVAGTTKGRILWLLMTVTQEGDDGSQSAITVTTAPDSPVEMQYVAPAASTNTLWVHGFSFWGTGEQMREWGADDYWRSSSPAGYPTLTGSNPFAVNYHARAYIGVSNVVLQYALDRHCVAPNSCVLACHSAGCAQSEFALATQNFDGSRWSVVNIVGAGAASGGSELATLGSWTGALGFLGRDLATTKMRGLYNHDAVGTPVGCAAGADGDLRSAILDGQDDDSVAYHSAGCARQALTYNNPSDLGGTTLPLGTSPLLLYAGRYVYFRDDGEEWEHSKMKEMVRWVVGETAP